MIMTTIFSMYKEIRVSENNLSALWLVLYFYASSLWPYMYVDVDGSHSVFANLALGSSVHIQVLMNKFMLL